MPPSSRRTKRRKSLLLLLSSKWRAWHRTLRPACARQTTSERSPRTSRRAFLSILVAACTLDMASRILPEYPVPIPAGRQIVSPANVLGVGPRRASVGAGLESRAVRGENYLPPCPILSTPRRAGAFRRWAARWRHLPLFSLHGCGWEPWPSLRSGA